VGAGHARDIVGGRHAGDLLVFILVGGRHAGDLLVFVLVGGRHAGDPLAIFLNVLDSYIVPGILLACRPAL
jgi:hypothetical protein